jgi:3-oxoacyl-[acyl-carrier-protein] synthase I
MSTNATRVGIIGAGARTPLGRSLRASEAAVRAGIARAGPHPFLVDGSSKPLKVARAEWLPERFDGAVRFVALAKNAAKETLATLHAHGGGGDRFRVFVGLPESRPGRPADLDEAITRALGRDAPWAERVEDLTVVSLGHAAAIVAIERAAAAVERGDVDLCLAGGVDSYLDAETLDWLEATGRLHAARRPWGFTPGEAAAFCVLASPRWLEAHRVEAPLTLIATASTEEAARIYTDRVCLGTGLSSAFDGALSSIRSTGERVTRLMGDLNGEPYRADELGFALSRAADALERPGDVLAPAQFWGDVGAASGALFVGLAFTAAARGHSPPGPTTLMWGSSEGGSRAAALVRGRASSRESEDT